MKREYKRTELLGRARLVQILQSLLTSEGPSHSGTPLTPVFFDFCQRVWDSNANLRKYVSESEIGEIFEFAARLVDEGKSFADAAKRTVDLLSQAATLLADQVKHPKIVGFLCPVQSIPSLPDVHTEAGLQVGPFTVFRCMETHIASLQETFREMPVWREDEFGQDISGYDTVSELTPGERKEVGIYRFPEGLQECFLNRICLRTEAARSPSTLWPGPIGLGGMFYIELYDQQLLERFKNLVRYVLPDFDIVLDSPRFQLDYEAKTAFLKTPGEPGATSILDVSNPTHLRKKLLNLHNALSLASKSELARSIEGAIFWVGSARSNIPERPGLSKPSTSGNAVDYLKFMIALESVLVMASDNVTTAVSSRVAHVLEKEYEEIERFKKRMRRLYDIRSRIVHEGEWYVSPPDIEELEKITRQLIDNLLVNPERWETKEELARWAEVKEWVTSESPDTHTPAEKVRQWITAIEEARS